MPFKGVNRLLLFKNNLKACGNQFLDGDILARYQKNSMV